MKGAHLLEASWSQTGQRSRPSCGGQPFKGGGSNHGFGTGGRVALSGQDLDQGECNDDAQTDVKDTEYETWLKVGSDGRISESVTTMKSTGDDLLQYAVRTGSTITQTDVASGSVFEFTLAPDTTKLNEWLRASAARPQRLLQEDEYEFVGRGSMDGKASVIFEYEYEAGSPMEGVRVPAGRVRLEFVEADPLLNREIHYAESPAGTDQVLESVETVEYEVLPADSEMPTLP